MRKALLRFFLNAYPVLTTTCTDVQLSLSLSLSLSHSLSHSLSLSLSLSHRAHEPSDLIGDALSRR